MEGETALSMNLSNHGWTSGSFAYPHHPACQAVLYVNPELFPICQALHSPLFMRGTGWLTFWESISPCQWLNIRGNQLSCMSMSLHYKNKPSRYDKPYN